MRAWTDIALAAAAAGTQKEQLIKRARPHKHTHTHSHLHTRSFSVHNEDCLQLCPAPPSPRLLLSDPTQPRPGPALYDP